MSTTHAAVLVEITGRDIGYGALVIAGVLALLALAFALLAARKALIKTAKSIEDVNARVGPLINNVNATVENVNVALTQVQASLDGVNSQLERVDSITGHAQQVSGNVANLTTLVTAAATTPLIKIASFGFGLRKATSKRRRAEEDREVRDTLRQRDAATKRRGLFRKKG